MSRPRVVLLRGHSVNPWDLRPFGRLEADYDVSVLVTGSNVHRTEGVGVPVVRIRSLRDVLPAGRMAGGAAYLAGERYLHLREHLAGADVVHSTEVGTWFSSQAAGLRSELGFRLVLTVWETLPWGDAYRWPRERRYRRRVLSEADLFLAATERARRCLLLEGADGGLVEVCAPGVELTHFANVPAGADNRGGHLLVSAGRLVWEKGHQDVLRALAALRRGLAGPPRDDVRLLVVGDGREQNKLRAHAEELGIGQHVEFRPTVPYDEMPALYREASCLILASLPTRSWEEQFGMVLAEAMASGLPVVASDSGAIPEVLAGQGALFAAGDWAELARLLGRGPLGGPPASRTTYDAGLIQKYSANTCAERLRAAYARVLESTRT